MLTLSGILESIVQVPLQLMEPGRQYPSFPNVSSIKVLLRLLEISSQFNGPDRGALLFVPKRTLPMHVLLQGMNTGKHIPLHI